jgi:hypothetical protein
VVRSAVTSPIVAFFLSLLLLISLVVLVVSRSVRSALLPDRSVVQSARRRLLDHLIALVLLVSIRCCGSGTPAVSTGIDRTFISLVIAPVDRSYCW